MLRFCFCVSNLFISFYLLGVHWLAMTIWIISQQTDFCENKVEEVFFDCVIGVIYCFNFFNLKEGQTRWRALLFYTVIGLENVACLVLWYMFKKRDWFDPLIAAGVFLLFVLGMLLTVVIDHWCT